MTDQKELIPMRPGDILRYEREQRGLTVSRAADQSRISSAVISAIETGETGQIPSVYLKGYIRNYAHFLGVDVKELADYMDSVQAAEPVVKSIFSADQPASNSERWIKATSYIAASVLVAALAWQVTHQAVKLSEQSKPHLNASIASSAEEDPVDTDTILSGQPSRLTSQQAESIVNDPQMPGHRSLTVRTSADTWIEISDANGKQLEMDLVRADSFRRYRGEAPFQVMIGRASAVILTLDSETVDLGKHTRGNVARMVLGATQMAENLPAEEHTEDTSKD